MTVALHRAPLVVPVTSPPVVDGAVAVADGRVLAVGPHDELTAVLADVPVHRVEWSGTILPGLVNAHTHLQYTCMAAVGSGRYAGFEDWSRSFVAAYARPHDWAASAADGARMALRSGTTAVADVVTDPGAATALHDAGLRGVAYWEVFAWTAARWRAEGVRAVQDALGRVPAVPGAGLSPHALYSVDTEVLRSLTALAAGRGLRQHVHAAESAWEDEYARTGTGLLADHWRRHGYGELALLASGGAGTSAVRYLESVGLLTSTTHLAHGVYVDEDDRALLRERDVVVALCPRSNAVIGLDGPPVAAYLREGNTIAVGTDSLSSSPSLGVLEDVAALHALARAQGYAHRDLHGRLLAAATTGGARALGLHEGDDAVGALRPGARADLVVLGTGSTRATDAVAELVETGTVPVTATYVDGTARWVSAGAPTGSVGLVTS